MNQLHYSHWLFRIFFSLTVCVLLNVLVTFSNDSMKLETTKFSSLDQKVDGNFLLSDAIVLKKNLRIGNSGRKLKAYYLESNFYDYTTGKKNVSNENQCLEWMQLYSISLLEHTDNLPEDVRLSWHEQNCGLKLIRRFVNITSSL